jgi:hypothetical protein
VTASISAVLITEHASASIPSSRNDHVVARSLDAAGMGCIAAILADALDRELLRIGG